VDSPLTRRTFLQLGSAAMSMALTGRHVATGAPSGTGRRTAQRSVSLRDDGTVLVNGQPFFPFGYYFIGPNYRTADERLAQHLSALRAMADAGFNLMYARADPTDLRRYGILLDEAGQRGISMLTTSASVPYNPTPHEMLTLVTAFQDKPAVLGWAISDDAGLHDSSPAAVSQVDAAVKAVDPHHLTYLSAVGELNVARFAAAADLLGCQAFYVHDDRKNWADPLQYIAPEYVRAKALAASYRHPIIANLQTFSWKGERGPGTDPHARWPTAAEVYSMTYQALLAGVRGIIYYAYQDFHTDVRAHPDVWQATVALVQEIRRLRAVILDGARLAMTTDGGHVRMGGWIYRGDAYVVVLNTSHTRTMQASLALPEGMTGPAVPLFPSRSTGLVYRRGRLTGLIRPSDVHIYVLRVQRAGAVESG
jgi:hypothetical protein